MNNLKCLVPELINFKGREWIEGLLTDLNMAIESTSYHHSAEVSLLRLREQVDLWVNSLDSKGGLINSLKKAPPDTTAQGAVTGVSYLKMKDGTWLCLSTLECYYSEDLIDLEQGRVELLISSCP